MVHRYRIILGVLLVAAFISPSLHAQVQKNGLTWYTDINKACAASNKAKKPIFALFTGSDWCVWCHRLENDVFDKASFKEWAKKNVILMEVDFPRSKRLPDEQARQNNSLQQFFKVQGYPTVWMFFMNKGKADKKFNITQLGSLGYPQTTPGQEDVAFLENANRVLKNKN